MQRPSTVHTSGTSEMSDKKLANAVISRLSGWVEYDGGEMPVPGDTFVMCQLQWETRNHAEAFGPILAEYLGWDLPRESTERIIAYKVVKRESN